MDTSETYVKMCEKAKELQDSWKPDCGDYAIISQRDNRVVIITCHLNIDIKGADRFVDVVFPESYGINVDYKKVQNMTWLPRQDQLQEMVKSDIHPHWQLNNFVDAGLSDYIQEMGEYTKQFSSMEQLWLALVMREKYSKIWNGEVWTKV